MKEILHKIGKWLDNRIMAFFITTLNIIFIELFGFPSIKYLCRSLYFLLFIPISVVMVSDYLYHIWKDKDTYYRSNLELRSIIDSMNKRIQYLNSDNKRLEMEIDILKEECIEKEGECTELRKQIERYQENISLDTIYTLYQFYLLIRKYNILDYTISLYPELQADVYCKMAVYTKMSINKEVLKNVRYHIYGTNVIL